MTFKIELDDCKCIAFDSHSAGSGTVRLRIERTAANKSPLELELYGLDDEAIAQLYAAFGRPKYTFGSAQSLADFQSVLNSQGKATQLEAAE